MYYRGKNRDYRTIFIIYHSSRKSCSGPRCGVEIPFSRVFERTIIRLPSLVRNGFGVFPANQQTAALNVTLFLLGKNFLCDMFIGQFRV